MHYLYFTDDHVYVKDDTGSYEPAPFFEEPDEDLAHEMAQECDKLLYLKDETSYHDLVILLQNKCYEREYLWNQGKKQRKRVHALLQQYRES